jgi:hypothetical protein
VRVHRYFSLGGKGEHCSRVCVPPTRVAAERGERADVALI